MRKTAVILLGLLSITVVVETAPAGPLARLRDRIQARRSPPAEPAPQAVPTAACPDGGCPLPKPKAVKETAPQSFEAALREQLALHPEHVHAKRVREVLDMPQGERRTRILTRMERHSIVHLGLQGEAGKIDWSKVNWQALLDTLLKFLAALLPFLLASNDAGVLDLVAWLLTL